jgi:hypothetical protein
MGVKCRRDLGVEKHPYKIFSPLSLAVKVCGANIRPDGPKSIGQLRKTSNGKKQKPKS